MLTPLGFYKVPLFDYNWVQIPRLSRITPGEIRLNQEFYFAAGRSRMGRDQEEDKDSPKQELGNEGKKTMPSLFTDDLHQHPFLTPSIKFAVKNLLPGA